MIIFFEEGQAKEKMRIAQQQGCVHTSMTGKK